MRDTTLLGRGTSAAGVPRVVQALTREVYENRVFYFILSSWFAYALAGSVLRQDGFFGELILYFNRAGRLALLLGYVVVVFAGVRVMLARPERPLKALAAELTALLPGRVVLRYVYGFGLLAIFMATFLHNKMLIPQLQPFVWDETFARWDKFLFAGYHPWQLLQPVVGYPSVTFVLDYAYTAWVPGIFLFWSWMIASRTVTQELRRRYWVATILSWILLGFVLATFLSSAGPCFLPQLLPQHAGDYAPLNAYLASLHQTDVLSSGLMKEHLLQVYSGMSTQPGGISAMPSMHNAQAMLFVLAGYRVNRYLGHAMLCYAIIIFVASIALAWHYAIDGVIGILGAALIWWFAGYLAQGRFAGRA